MELVEFMSNKECVVETFKVNGLIAKDSKHPIKYTIPNITKAAIPIVGYAAFAIYSHSFFHLCGSICSSSSFVAFCIYGILAITSFR